MLSRARLLSTLSHAPGAHLERQRSRLHQQLREARASWQRRIASERGLSGRRALVLSRKAGSTVMDCRGRRVRELEALSLLLGSHDPQRTLERGYVLVSTPEQEPLESAERARAAGEVRLRFADGSLGARILEQ